MFVSPVQPRITSPPPLAVTLLQIISSRESLSPTVVVVVVVAVMVGSGPAPEICRTDVPLSVVVPINVRPA